MNQNSAHILLITAAIIGVLIIMNYSGSLQSVTGPFIIPETVGNLYYFSSDGGVLSIQTPKHNYQITMNTRSFAKRFAGCTEPEYEVCDSNFIQFDAWNCPVRDYWTPHYSCEGSCTPHPDQSKWNAQHKCFCGDNVWVDAKSSCNYTGRSGGPSFTQINQPNYEVVIKRDAQPFKYFGFWDVRDKLPGCEECNYIQTATYYQVSDIDTDGTVYNLTMQFGNGIGLESSGLGGKVTLTVYKPQNVCGNNIITSPEICDGTNFGSKTCATEKGTGYTGSLQCTSSCTQISTTSCIAPVSLCTNGVKDTGEHEIDCGGSCPATCYSHKVFPITTLQNKKCNLQNNGDKCNIVFTVDVAHMKHNSQADIKLTILGTKLNQSTDGLRNKYDWRMNKED